MDVSNVLKPPAEVSGGVSNVLKPPVEVSGGSDRFEYREGISGKRDTCFDLYLDLPQACKYRNFTKDDTMRI